MSPNDAPPVTPHIAVRFDGPIAIAELVNPAKKNAITPGMWDELGALIARIEGDRAVRALLIRGSESAFCAGADIAGFDAMRRSNDHARTYDKRIEDICSAIEALPQPSVAMLAGPVVGAGLELAAACDLRIASPDAYLMLPAVRLGLGFDPWACALLARAFGPALARQFLITGTRVSAERAHTLGAVNELVPAEELGGATMHLLSRLASNAPLSMAAAKTSLRAAASGDPGLLDAAQQTVDAANASHDYAEGRAAFAEKRSPRFEGR